jgi:hypothetical protein
VFDDLMAHLNAVEHGHDVLPEIREVVLAHDWSSPGPPGSVGVLTALMLAAQDIDEAEARSLSEDLASGRRCHPLFLSRLKSITALSSSDYQRFDMSGTRLFVANSLEKAQGVAATVEHWLSRVPFNDVQAISSIYIVEQTERDYWGQYLQVLSKITLVWRGWNSPTLRERLGTEFTLYHEVGHHVHRRRRCSSSEHEALADAYALERFGTAHPIIGRFFGTGNFRQQR